MQIVKIEVLEVDYGIHRTPMFRGLPGCLGHRVSHTKMAELILMPFGL